MVKIVLNSPQYNFSWYDFFKNHIELKKYKIPELKQIAKNNRLPVSGTKSNLMVRIENYFNFLKHVTKIQAWSRRFLVILSFKLRGPAFKNRSICVNSSDFYTLENLTEIEFDDFFSYTDEKGFVYGFQIDSLIQLFKKTGTITNPYNRDQLDYTVVRNIIKLYKINSHIFQSNRQIKTITNHNPYINENVFINMHSLPEMGNGFSRMRTLQKIYEMRQKNMNERITELFIEIDLLGNYTHSEWFAELDDESLIQFMQKLYDIWNYRSNMSYSVKMLICPFFNPFLFNVDINEDFNQNIRRNCVTILENIVFSGGEIEYRKIGTLHILTALTMVSEPTRNALPWLYDSVI